MIWLFAKYTWEQRLGEKLLKRSKRGATADFSTFADSGSRNDEKVREDKMGIAMSGHWATAGGGDDGTFDGGCKARAAPMMCSHYSIIALRAATFCRICGCAIFDLFVPRKYLLRRTDR